MNAGLVVIILLVGLSILGIPIFLSLGIATAIGVQMLGLPFVMIPQKMFTGMDSPALMAIPFFILAGNIMSRSITGKLINVSDALIGWIKGSLGIVTVLASALFGAISGSAVATVSAVGGITIPAMKKQGYGAPFASAVTSMASILGPLVPPSITLIVYASITEIAVSKLFISSVIPALILVAFLIVYMLWYGKKHDLPANERKSGKEIWITIKKSIWALLMPVIIMGTIFGGICTATESAVISVIYAIVISVFVYRDMKWSELPKLIIDAGISTATIMVLVGLSKASSYVVTTSRLPQLVSTTFTSITDSKILILVLVNVLFLILGMLMEANSAVIMMTPILLPLVKVFGVDPIQFGMIMCLNLYIGLMTPPVGLSLLLGNKIADCKIGDSIKAALPMLGLGLLLLLMVTYIPPLTLALPSLLS